MDALRQALGMGLELSVYILSAYWAHEYISGLLSADPNIVLVTLIMMVLTLWFVRIYLAYGRRDPD